MITAILTACNQMGNNLADSGGDITQTTKESTPIQVLTVDEQGSPLPADSVKWWTQGNRIHQHRFNCANAECTTWNGAVPINLPVIIRADASRIKADDKHCSQLYSSEQLYENNIANIRIILKPAGVVCR